MIDSISYQGIEYKIGRFQRLVNGNADKWEERILRIMADQDKPTKFDEFSYEMYLLARKEDLRDTRNK